MSTEPKPGTPLRKSFWSHADLKWVLHDANGSFVCACSHECDADDIKHACNTLATVTRERDEARALLAPPPFDKIVDSDDSVMLVFDSRKSSLAFLAWLRLLNVSAAALGDTTGGTGR